MSFEIVHLSDLHFGNPNAHLRRSEVDRALDALLSQATSPNSVLIISGDITFQGQKKGYREAADVISSAVKRRGLDPRNVLVCPGNHDVVKEEGGRPYFESFDEWSAGVRGDKKCTFANASARLIAHDIGDFVLLNTAYHAKYEMGLVDLRAAEKLLQGLPTHDAAVSPRLRVAVAHHHIIPVLDEDTSTTRNAYKLIKLLETYGFSGLLHGHQHAVLRLSVGKNNLLLSGVGSLGFLTAGYINSAAVYRGEGGRIDEVEYFGLTLDAPSGIVKIRSVTN